MVFGNSPAYSRSNISEDLFRDGVSIMDLSLACGGVFLGTVNRREAKWKSKYRIEK